MKRILGLALAGQPPLHPVPHKDLIPAKGVAHSPVFRVGALSGAWAAAKEGLLHPHTREQRPVVFDGRLAEGRDDALPRLVDGENLDGVSGSCDAVHVRLLESCGNTALDALAGVGGVFVGGRASHSETP